MPYIYGLILDLELPDLAIPGIVREVPHITILHMREKPKQIPQTLPINPFVAKPSGIEPLPSQAKPRHIVLMLEPVDRFLELRKSLGDYLDKYIEFRPHLTLYAIRAKYHWRDIAKDVIPVLRPLLSLRILVSEVQLIDTGGARYEIIARVPLGGSDRGFLVNHRHS